MRDDCCCDTWCRCDMGRKSDYSSNDIWITTSNSTLDLSLYKRTLDRMNEYFPNQDNYYTDPNDIYTSEITLWNNKYFEEQVKMYNLNELQLDKNIENLRKINGSIEIEGSIHTIGKTTITIPTSMLDFVRIFVPKDFGPECACITPTLTPTNCINIPKAYIPNVSRVETYNNRVVKVVFTDGTYTKAVCSENDTFDLDTGITICIMKRFFGKDNKTGTREYNRLIRNVHGKMDENEKEKERLAKEKAERKAKQKKLEQKRIAGREAARQEYIDDIAAGVSKALAERKEAM